MRQAGNAQAVLDKVSEDDEEEKKSESKKNSSKKKTMTDDVPRMAKKFEVKQNSPTGIVCEERGPSLDDGHDMLELLDERQEIDKCHDLADDSGKHSQAF